MGQEFTLTVKTLSMLTGPNYVSRIQRLIHSLGVTFTLGTVSVTMTLYYSVKISPIVSVQTQTLSVENPTTSDIGRKTL